MSSVGVLNRIRQLAEGYWPSSAFSSEDVCRTHVLALVHEIQASAAQYDFAAVDKLYDLYNYAEPYCRIEPLATAFDLGAMLIGCVLAQARSQRGEWQEAYRLIERVYRILELGDARRERERMPARSNSEVKYWCLKVLAEIKYEDRSSLKQIKAPDAIYGDYQRVKAHVLKYLQDYPYKSRDRQARVKRALLLTGVEVLKMYYRYTYDTDLAHMATGLLSGLNRDLSAGLVAKIGHCRYDHRTVHSVEYWDFELCKLWVSGQLNQHDIETCYEKRHAAFAALPAALRVTQYDQSTGYCWRRQRLVYEAGAFQPLQLVASGGG